MQRDLLYKELEFLVTNRNANDVDSEYEITSTSKFNFKSLVDNYPAYANFGFVQTNVISALDLYKKIGGNFADNALKRSKGVVEIEKPFLNSCTVRLSHALNLAGLRIAKNMKRVRTLPGKTHMNYIFGVLEMKRYLTRKFGNPDISIADKSLTAAEKESPFTGHQGIIIFLIKYKDANGHLTLWDGNDIGGATSSKEHNFELASEVHLWKIK